MEQIIAALAEQLSLSPEHITITAIDERNHTVDFRAGRDYWAKLDKTNTKVLRNSVRVALY